MYFIFFRDSCGINIQIRVSMILTYKRVASRSNIQRTCSIIFRIIIFTFIWVTFEQKINNTMIFFISMRVRFHIGVYGRVARAVNVVYVGALIMAKSLIIIIDRYTIIFGAMLLFVTLFFTQMTDQWRSPAASIHIVVSFTTEITRKTLWVRSGLSFVLKVIHFKSMPLISPELFISRVPFWSLRVPVSSISAIYTGPVVGVSRPTGVLSCPSCESIALGEPLWPRVTGPGTCGTRFVGFWDVLNIVFHLELQIFCYPVCALTI